MQKVIVEPSASKNPASWPSASTGNGDLIPKSPYKRSRTYSNLVAYGIGFCSHKFRITNGYIKTLCLRVRRVAQVKEGREKCGVMASTVRLVVRQMVGHITSLPTAVVFKLPKLSSMEGHD